MSQYWRNWQISHKSKVLGLLLKKRDCAILHPHSHGAVLCWSWVGSASCRGSISSPALHSLLLPRDFHTLWLHVTCHLFLLMHYCFSNNSSPRELTPLCYLCESVRHLFTKSVTPRIGQPRIILNMKDFSNIWSPLFCEVISFSCFQYLLLLWKLI
jgi:hypothetical protein